MLYSVFTTPTQRQLPVAQKFYVVWHGREPGIYTDWAACRKQVDKFAGARYKSFPTREEAEAAFAGSAAPKRPMPSMRR